MKKTIFRVASALVLASMVVSPAVAQPVTEFKPLQSHQSLAKGRPLISEGQPAADAIAIQNLMSRHEYMHAAGCNLEEIDNYWVSRNGQFAATATHLGRVRKGWSCRGLLFPRKWGNPTRQCAYHASNQGCQRPIGH